MKYYSTNNITKKVTLTEAVAAGYAPDMGLYVPENIPSIPFAFFKNMASMSLQEISYAVANTLFGTDVPSETLRDIVYKTMDFEIPLVHVHDNTYVLELFHGPTLGFKDVGTRFLARMMSYLHHTDKSNYSTNIITATSGSSGGAIASGFYDIPGINVYVLYPRNKLSRVQEAQFTTLGHNVTAIEINGSYDDCRSLVKSAFADHELVRRMHLTSANSINIARLLPQTFYYFYAVAQLYSRYGVMPRVSISIPCGNYGNFVSALISHRMGLPIDKFVVATSSNRALTPALCIDKPNNIGRVEYFYDNSVDLMKGKIIRADMSAIEITECMKSTYNRYDYIMEPHTATAYAAAEANTPAENASIVIGTAHPAKSRKVVEQIIGTKIELPENLAILEQKQRTSVKMSPLYSSLKEYLLTSLQ